MSNELTEVKPFVLMDAEDEKQIIAEMRGEIIKAYVYRYTDKGHTVEGLSKAGVDAVAMNLAMQKKPLRVLGHSVVEDDKYIKAIVKVGRYIINEDGTESLLDTTLGTKRQAKFYVGGRENPFAYEQAVVKAERNGKRKLMPEKIIIEMMKLYKNQGRTKDIENGKIVNPKSTSAKKSELGGAKTKEKPSWKKMPTSSKKQTNASGLAPLELATDHELTLFQVKQINGLRERINDEQWNQTLEDLGLKEDQDIKTEQDGKDIIENLKKLLEVKGGS